MIYIDIYENTNVVKNVVGLPGKILRQDTKRLSNIYFNIFMGQKNGLIIHQLGMIS